jgi:hypothetical protein
VLGLGAGSMEMFSSFLAVQREEKYSVTLFSISMFSSGFASSHHGLTEIVDCPLRWNRV